MLRLPISRTTLQHVDQPQSSNAVRRKKVPSMVVLHVDLLIPGVGKVPAVDVGFGVALVLLN